MPDTLTPPKDFVDVSYLPTLDGYTFYGASGHVFKFAMTGRDKAAVEKALKDAGLVDVQVWAPAEALPQGEWGSFARFHTLLEQNTAFQKLDLSNAYYAQGKQPRKSGGGDNVVISRTTLDAPDKSKLYDLVVRDQNSGEYPNPPVQASTSTATPLIFGLGAVALAYLLLKERGAKN